MIDDCRRCGGSCASGKCLMPPATTASTFLFAAAFIVRPHDHLHAPTAVVYGVLKRYILNCYMKFVMQECQK